MYVNSVLSNKNNSVRLLKLLIEVNSVHLLHTFKDHQDGLFQYQIQLNLNKLFHFLIQDFLFLLQFKDMELVVLMLLFMDSENLEFWLLSLLLNLVIKLLYLVTKQTEKIKLMLLVHQNLFISMRKKIVVELLLMN